MKKLLLVFFVYQLYGADVSNKPLTSNSNEIFCLSDHMPLELPKSIKINSGIYPGIQRFPCIPRNVLSDFAIFADQSEWKGETTIPCENHTFQKLYPVAQAKYLKKRGIITSDDFETFLRTRSLSHLYQCAAAANELNEEETLQCCVKELSKPSAIRDLIHHCEQSPDRQLSDFVGYDFDVRGLIAKQLVEQVPVPEFTTLLKIEPNEFRLNAARDITLQRLRCGVVLALGFLYADQIDGYFILRKGRNPERIQKFFFAEDTQGISIEDIPGKKSLILSHNRTGEVKAVKSLYTGKFIADRYYPSNIKKTQYASRIAGEYLVTASDRSFHVLDLQSKKGKMICNLFTRTISVLATQKRLSDNELYIGLENGDFHIFDLNAHRKAPSTHLVNACEPIVHTGIDEEKACVIKPILQDGLHGKHDMILFGRKSGGIICYDLEEKKELFTISLEKGIICLDIHPSDSTLVLTAHDSGRLNLWSRSDKDFSLLWSYEMLHPLFSTTTVGSVCWLDDNTCLIAYDGMREIEELPLKKILDFIDFVRKNSGDLHKMLALCIARDALHTKNMSQVNIPHIKEQLKTVPCEEIKKWLGL